MWRYFKELTRRSLTPERTLIASFVITILLGTYLLSLPYSAKAKSASFIDALFTATSAVCVTGLIVVDTGQFYSRFGQMVILILIQLGGLGIMTFSVFFYLLLGRSISEQILVSYFQSVTSRTAGFNTIPMIGLSNATCFVLVILMFIGASPGSCGGGIKTTNLATLVSLAFNRYKGRDQANLFKRTIPHERVSRSISIILASVSVVIIITVFLLITQLGDLSHPESRGQFLEYLFETVSAFGTVGLSMGATTKLNAAGKVIIIIMMLLGRLGPLTLAFAMARRVKKGEFQYAEENIIVG